MWTQCPIKQVVDRGQIYSSESIETSEMIAELSYLTFKLEGRTCKARLLAARYAELCSSFSPVVA